MTGASLVNIYYVTTGKEPTNAILSLGFPSLSILPYVHFSACSEHSIFCLQQSCVSATITKQGIKIGKLTKVAAISLTFYRLHICLDPLSETSCNRLMMPPVVLGTIFEKLVKNPFCNRSKKHKHNWENPNTDLA